MIKKISKNI